MDVSCIAERFDLAHASRKLGFLREEAHLRAALTMPLRMAEQALASGVYTPEASNRLRALIERGRAG